ncbi:hypothetical protein [Flavobacterium cerinum]|uniref:Uncharacterized protein n=1 Tax=Flavobacterium cerinum TaxID=2502784 RepID=A0A3S4SWA3_9FLAO|nr:hypothetical protein [Flavobacterium cerinum]RWW93808.1 hypothetical protein EPI11_14840 [Flavobacterium cerinum]
MKEVLIEKDFTKKEKLKSVYFGKNSTYLLVNLFFDDIPEYYLVDNIPYGGIKELTLFFCPSSKSTEILMENGYRFDKVNNTEFELTIYKVSDEGSLGDKVNQVAIPIVLEQNKSDATRKIKIDISKYNFIGDKFFVFLKRISDASCYECYYYLPVSYLADRKLIYAYNKKELMPLYTKGLRVKVQTLTRDY